MKKRSRGQFKNRKIRIQDCLKIMGNEFAWREESREWGL